jgi:CheY-like chemotaxis protein
VLLVDDDTFVHDIVGMLLREEEYLLRSATNVKDAMQMIATDPPDILITDAIMPGESGFSLIERLKSDPRTKEIPVILLTILEQPDGSVMDATSKADIAVNKPLYSSDIISGVERAKQLMDYRREIKVVLPEPVETIKVVLR